MCYTLQVKRLWKFITFKDRLARVYDRMERLGFELFLERMKGVSENYNRRSRNYIKTIDKLERIEKKAWF